MLLLTPPFLSQSFAASAVSAQDLRGILARYQDLQKLDVDFKQTKILKDIQLRLESSGHLKIEPPNRVEWLITKPSLMRVNLKGSQIQIHSSEQQQSLSLEEGASEKDLANLNAIMSWLRLDTETIAKNYQIQKLNSNRYEFQSRVHDQSAIQRLTMVVAPDGYLTELHFFESSGDEIQLRFSSPKIIARKAP